MQTELEKILENCWGDSAPPCQAACPIHLDAKGYILAIKEGRYQDGLSIIRERLPFPGIIGRICNHPCETHCRRKEKEEAIAICELKRFLSDLEGDTGWLPQPPEQERIQRIAVVGAGPAGLMAAYELRKLGYRVTIFEASAYLGGMMKLGIPRFRLPEDILEKETNIIYKMGVDIRLNTKLGRDIKLNDMKSNFDAVFVATGTDASRKINIEGTDLEGVLWGVDFLTDVNLGHAPIVKGKVVVIGGGNVAVDAGLTALRLGAKEVKLVCLESKDEMPAFPAELKQAIEEGIIVDNRWGPNKILGDGKVTGIEFVRCVSAFDEQGRFNPAYDPAQTTRIDTDMVIIAIGQASDLSFITPEDRIAVERGMIVSDRVTLATTTPGIFAGGDAVYGPKSVVEALASGHRAAISIDRYFRGEDIAAGRELEDVWESKLAVSIEEIPTAERVAVPALPPEERRGNFAEVKQGYTEAQAQRESERCLQCECKLCVKDCELLKMYCTSPKELAQKFQRGYHQEKPEIPYSCTECELCSVVCPNELCSGKMFMELRKQLVKEGKGPLPPHQFVTRDQEFATSENFTLTLPGPDASETKRAFFPGCSLSGNSPQLVLKAYEYLREKLPGTGIMLRCCGTPTHLLGQEEKFEGILGDVEEEMKKWGIEELIVACPDCYLTFRRCAPHIKVRSLYEVIAEKGLPEIAKKRIEQTFTVHDACKGRNFPEFTESVRKLIQQMGYRLSEMEYSKERTRCCGIGGMMPYVNPSLSQKLIKARAAEAPNDIVSFCAGCRGAFASVGAPSLHILDLLFSPDIEEAKVIPAQTGKSRRENMNQFKGQLQELFGRKTHA